ncbi:MAG TPA: ligase-associated DNA damage response endonuclease PdeM [Rhizomicrobium sp.]|nr:ligase-associated DNA damage response endonuclease PdeM [Rhizomicrobium sp.]
MWTDLSVTVNGEALVLDKSGAAWWPRTSTLIFADLHFEKGSSYARFGQFLPPYDTRATLLRMAEVVARRSAARVIALGDSFHDPLAAARLPAEEFAMLSRLTQSVHFLWITGNHDPLPPSSLRGAVMAEWREGGLVFRHEPLLDAEPGEMAGHLHPCAKVAKYGRGVRRRAFAADTGRMILPAFGAYAGGLDVGDPAIARLFGTRFHAFMLGEERVYAIPRQIGRRNKSDEIQPMIRAIRTVASP